MKAIVIEGWSPKAAAAIELLISTALAFVQSDGREAYMAYNDRIALQCDPPTLSITSAVREIVEAEIPALVRGVIVVRP